MSRNGPFRGSERNETEWNSAKKLGLTEQPHRADVAQIGCNVDQLGCDVAQMIVHQLAVRQARVSSIPGSAPQGGFVHTELTSDEETERNLGGCDG